MKTNSSIFTSSSNKLVYHNPALGYDKSSMQTIMGMPMGNGMMGVMLYGEPGNEILALNHNRLWRNKIDKTIRTADIVNVLRKDRLTRNAKKADEVFLEAIKEVPMVINSFQPFGNLSIQIPSIDSYKEYHRELDLQKGVAHISYKSGGIAYGFECFISEKHDVLMLKLSTDKSGALDCRLTLSRIDDPECNVSIAYDKGLLLFNGEFKEGISFAAAVNILHNSGRKNWENNGIVIHNADMAMITLALETSHIERDPMARCRRRISRISDEYEQVKTIHMEDHGNLYNRAQLTLHSDHTEDTEGLFETVLEEKMIDNRVYEQIFNMGRYLMISSSRPGSLPMNLHGIWNDNLNPLFECSYTTDLNVQMNYRMTAPCNLLECEQPLFDWICGNIDKLKQSAKEIFGCKGVYIPQYADYKFTPYCSRDGAFQLLWSGAAAWMAQHFYEYWRYTGDERFLLECAYPYMKECANFYKEFLIKSAGKYIIYPSCSPEQKTDKGTYLVNSSTMDITLIHELLSNLINISNAYNLDEEERRLWAEINHDIIQYPVDEEGCLREWVDDAEVGDPHHRHLSHLYGLFPGKLFTSENSSDLYKAAIKALHKRKEGGGAGSWWPPEIYPGFAGCFARIGDGDAALTCINDLLMSGQTLNNYFMVDHRTTGPDLNALLGATEAIAEMLIQSYDDVIKILPALPSAWPNGRFSGLRGYDGFVFDIEWLEGRITHATVRSHNGGACSLQLCRPFPGIDIKCDGKAISRWHQKDSKIQFETEKGRAYILFPDV